MSDYDDDFEAAESPQKDSEQPSWLHPLNKRATSGSEGSKSASHSPRATPSTDASIPPTPSTDRTPSNSPRRPPSPPVETNNGPSAAAASSDGYSDVDDASAPEPAPAWTNVKPPKQAQSTTSEIAELRRRNAELQSAVAAVKEQLAKVAPKLDAGVRRKHSAENERMNKLQEESANLRAEQARLTKKLKDVDQVTTLEKQLRERQQELKTLNERNKTLQVEIRTNAKKLKQMATIEEQRSKMLASIKQEQKVAQNAVLKAERDAELAIQARDGAAERLKALELKDKVPELKPEDVRMLIEMKQTLASKQETIEALQYRLSVLKRAHESAQRHLASEPTDTGEIESLRAEVVALRAKLEVGQAHAADKTPQPSGRDGSRPSADRSTPPVTQLTVNDQSVSEGSHKGVTPTSAAEPGDAIAQDSVDAGEADDALSESLGSPASSAAQSTKSAPPNVTSEAADAKPIRGTSDPQTAPGASLSSEDPDWLDE